MANTNPYYQHPFLSNSDLTKLKREISGADHKDYQQAFRRGSILDCYITQPEIRDELQLTADERAYGEKGFRVFISDPYCLQLHRTSRKQHQFYREGMKFRYNNIDFSLDCKCMYDGTNAPVLGWDVKNTIALTQDAFIDACYYFDYFRARAWYMNLSGLPRDMIIGINIERGRVFKVPIVKGDKFHLFGKQQYNELAYKFWALKGNNYGKKNI